MKLAFGNWTRSKRANLITRPAKSSIALLLALDEDVQEPKRTEPQRARRTHKGQQDLPFFVYFFVPFVVQFSDPGDECFLQ